MKKLKAILAILRGESVMYKISTVGDYDVLATTRTYFTGCNWNGRVTVNGIPVIEYTGVEINKQVR